MPSKKVLLVDDIEMTLIFEKLLLKGLDVTIATARDGEEALAAVRDDPPDLILLDIVMPKLDGIEVCRRIKQNPATAHIPIIVVTTQGQDRSLQLAVEAGCDDFLTKPIDRAQLLKAVRRRLEIRSR